MTVKELIEKLQTFDEHSTVVCPRSCQANVADVKTVEEYSDGVVLVDSE